MTAPGRNSLPQESNMSLDNLSIAEWLVVGRQAETLWVERLRRLAAACATQDPQLSDELGILADEEEAHRATLARSAEGAPLPQVWRLDESAVHRLLHQRFPALTSVARPRLDRPNLAALVDAVESECLRFYEEAAAAPGVDAEHRDLFLSLAAEERHHREHGLLA